MKERKDLRRLSLISKIKKDAKSLATIIDHWCIIDVSDGSLMAIDDYIKMLNDYRKEIKEELSRGRKNEKTTDNKNIKS